MENFREQKKLEEQVKKTVKEQAEMSDYDLERERGGYLEELKTGVPRLTEEEIAKHEEVKKRREALKRDIKKAA